MKKHPGSLPRQRMCTMIEPLNPLAAKFDDPHNPGVMIQDPVEVTIWHNSNDGVSALS